MPQLCPCNTSASQAVLVASMLLGVVQDAGHHYKVLHGIGPDHLTLLSPMVSAWSIQAGRVGSLCDPSKHSAI